jgi:hypothetical protein
MAAPTINDCFNLRVQSSIVNKETASSGLSPPFGGLIAA